MGAFGRLEPMMERICALLNERAKGNLNMAQTVLSASKDEDYGASWAMLELDLKTEGVPPEYIDGNMDRIKEVLTAVCDINHLDGIDTDTIHPEESVSQIGDRCDNEDGERTIINAPSKMKRPPTRRSRDISYQDWLRNLSPEQNAARILLMNRTGIDIKDFDFEIDKKPASVGSRKQGGKALWPILKKMPMKYSKVDITKEYTGRSAEAVRWACQNGEKEILSLLLEAGCDPSSILLGSSEYSPILVAATRGHWSLVDLLLDYGVNPRFVYCQEPIPIESGFQGFGLIHFASYRDQPELLRILLDQNIPVNARSIAPDGSRFWCTPLLCAAITGSYAAAKLLIEKGASVNDRLEPNLYGIHPHGISNYYPLHFAVEKKNVKLAKLILDSGASVNAYTTARERPLHIAIRVEDFNIAKLLLASGAWVDAGNKYGHTPLYSLFVKNNEAFAGIHIKVNQYNRPIDLNVRTIEIAKKIYPLVQLLIDKGANVTHDVKPWIDIMRACIGLKQADSRGELTHLLHR